MFISAQGANPNWAIQLLAVHPTPSRSPQHLFTAGKRPFCFPLYAKLSAYCCKSFELYFCGQALAIFLSPVAFFPPSTPSAPSWTRWPGTCRSPTQGQKWHQGCWQQQNLFVEVLCRQQGRDWDVGRRFEGSGRAGWCSPCLTYNLSSHLQSCNLWARLLAQVIYFLLLVLVWPFRQLPLC